MTSATRLALITASFACSLGLTTACTTTPSVRTHASPSLQQASYRTYGFYDNPGTNRAGYSTLVTQHFQAAIRREMDARGYVFAQGNPDLLVNFNATTRDTTEVRSTPTATVGMGYYGYRYGLYAGGPIYGGVDVDTVQYKVGTANVDLVDAVKKELVWEGVAEGRLKDSDLANPQGVISSVVAEMFAGFPGKAGGQR